MLNRNGDRCALVCFEMAPASKITQGSRQLSGTRQTIPKDAFSSAAATSGLQRLPLAISSDDTQGSTPGKTIGSHSRSVIAMRWLVAPDQLMNTRPPPSVGDGAIARDETEGPALKCWR